MKSENTTSWLLQKVENDPAAAVILEHLVDGVAVDELESFFVDDVIRRHRDLSLQSPAPWRRPDARPFNLVKCFDRGLELLAPAVPLAAIKSFAELLLGESDELRISHFRHTFLRTRDLYLLEPRLRSVIIAHILDRLENAACYFEFTALKGLGGYLTPDAAISFLDAVVSGLSWLQYENSVLINRAINLAVVEIVAMETPAQRVAIAHIKSELATGGPSASKLLQQLTARMRECQLFGDEIDTDEEWRGSC